MMYSISAVYHFCSGPSKLKEKKEGKFKWQNTVRTYPITSNVLQSNILVFITFYYLGPKHNALIHSYNGLYIW